MIAHGQPCGECGVPMIRAQPNYARRPPPEGMQIHGGGGMCARCARKARTVHSAGGALPGRPRKGSERDVDWVKVYRVIGEIEDMPLTHAEVRLAAHAMTRLGVPARAIARRLKICERTVGRYRAQEAVYVQGLAA